MLPTVAARVTGFDRIGHDPDHVCPNAESTQLPALRTGHRQHAGSAVKELTSGDQIEEPLGV